MRFLSRLLSSVISEGQLRIVGPDGRIHSFGPPSRPMVELRVEKPDLGLSALFDPELRFAEAIIDGRLRLQKGSLQDLMTLYFRNRHRFHALPGQRVANRLFAAWRAVAPAISPALARRNAGHHYDLGNAFYRLWLDEDMQYSCAYFAPDAATLEEAQTAKKRHIAAKLGLEPGMRVLDIGCGWGGMALYLAMAADVHVTGVTLSTEQAEAARARVRELGLGDRVRIELADYRDVAGRFDRIVSVGMLEHVGAAALPAFFETVARLLAPEGVALVHSIGNRGRPGPPPSFITRYIFPGGHVPSLSEAMAAVEGAGLWTLDCEVLRLHYARTLAEWRERFLRVRERVVAEQGERFAVMWELYLSGCEAAFRHGDVMVFQLQLGRARDAMPLTRDYLAQAEAALAAREPEILPRLFRSTERALGPAPGWRPSGADAGADAGGRTGARGASGGS